MPPKRGRGRGRGRGGRGAAAKKSPLKRVKDEPKEEEDDDEPPQKIQKEESFSSKLRRIVKEEADNSTTHKVYKVDYTLLCMNTGIGKKLAIHEDYTCMLNQTNIGHNNNKFYVIQIATGDKKGFLLFTKWGRVGEDGQTGSVFYTKEEEAIKAFQKKFKDKTKNDWDKRDAFSPAPGKYTMIEISQESDDDEEEPASTAKLSDAKKMKSESRAGGKCCLDERTQRMIKLIFNSDMFVDQMTAMNLDTRKMPLGKLSKSQILKGLDALLDIDKEIKGKARRGELQTLSSRFYTLIPHNFGRSVPPVIDTQDVVDQKKEIITTLTDIEIAQSLQKEDKVKDEAMHILDENYNKLECKMELLANNSEEFTMIAKYATACKNTRPGKLLDVWTVDRANEGSRFRAHDDISYRKLLWHGTNVAVVAAILKSGMRIMPHSGGLVGAGIYFASEHAKSAWYVRPHCGSFEKEKNVGFMFLTEVALGKMNFITQCASHLRAAPKGFDSVVARGSNEPDPKKEVKKEFEGKDVIIPLGTPVSQKDYKDSGFCQSEYLIYKESQARIRYLLKFSFN